MALRFLLNFNSNMVRLKGGKEHEGESVGKTFQFQYGSIKRNRPLIAYAFNLISIPIWFD